MHIRSILNRVEKLKGFVYESERFITSGDRPSIEVVVRPRKGTQGYCGGCGNKGPTYDTGEP